MTAFPLSYKDPQYAALASAVETQLGLPTGILNAIRMRGERSNADQISTAGARTPYQFIQPTRQGFIQQYNIDPWADPYQATEAAGLHLRDDHTRTGSWNEAIARYYGGGRPGTSSYKYAARVGDFDNTGANNMGVVNSLYPVVNGVDPLAPEPPTQPVPISNSAAPSQPMPATAPAAQKKRGGILGALESVFMPDPGSLWAGALRDGVFNAKESQQNYQLQRASQLTNLAAANAKLQQMLTKGEYQVVGNNVFHMKPDGTTEMITAPNTLDQKTKLIDLWQQRHANDPNDPTLPILEKVITGSSESDKSADNATRLEVARINAGARVKAAGIVRPPAPPPALPPLPPGFHVVK